jgi:hypothetical protein
VILLLVGCIDYETTKVVDPATAADAAPSIELDPPLLEFAPVALGEVAVLPLTVRNVGEVVLTVDGTSILGTTAFTVLADLPVELEPGAELQWDVTFSPVNPSDEATLSVSSDDPERPEATVPLLGGALAPELLVYPNPLAFGAVALGCNATLPLGLYNAGAADLVIADLAESGAGWSVALPVLPITLAPGEDTFVDVTFTPNSVAESTGVLYITSNDLVPVRTATHTGNGATDDAIEEEFVQADGPWASTDILLSVDGSCSMDDDQTNLTANFAAFTTALASADMDWQMYVVTNDDGCHASRLFTAADVTVEELDRAVRAPHGVWTEAGLTLVANALAETGRGGCNEGLLRPDAKTTVIVVSDEGDQSPAPWDDMLGTILGHAPNASVHAIVGDVPWGCATAAPGTGYHEAALQTGGAFLSLCDGDWGSSFRTIAALAASGQTDTFVLDNRPDASTLAVAVDEAASSAWRYDTASNAVIFDAGAVPSPGGRIRVSYRLSSDCEG